LATTTAPPPDNARAGDEVFSTAKLAALQQQGRGVFVDATAAWCVSCIVNERLTLQATAVRAAFAAHDIALLKADWTRQNPEVTAFLRSHAQEGVPLYVFYPPDHGAPIVLPAVLTESAVLAAIEPHPG